MRTLSFLLAPLLLTIAFPAGPALADGPLIRDQSAIRLRRVNMSSAVPADDFALAATTRLTRATVWVADSVANDNGELDAFGGTLSWAIFDDDSGSPGSLLQIGSAAALEIVDMGFQLLGGDFAQISFELEPALTLDAGTYWFAAHEGAWGSADDGTTAWWTRTDPAFGADFRYATEETNPVSWSVGTDDLAFTLYGGEPAWNQEGGIEGANGWPISDYVGAVDFTLASTRRISALEVWLGDDTVNDNGVVDDFGGTLSWAIYSNGTGEPGSVLVSGHDSTPLQIDTGLQDFIDSDLVRVRVRMRPPVELSAGTYWIALHEGLWGSPTDGSRIYWSFSPSVVGAALEASSDEENPSGWFTEHSLDSAVVLFEELVFASGFEAGVVCAWSNGADVACP